MILQTVKPAPGAVGLLSKRFISFRLPSLKPSSLQLKIATLKLKEQPPGYIVGTVNDAYVPPPSEYQHGSYHWLYEKVTTLSMVPLSILPFIVGTPYPLFDAAFCSLLVAHCRAGFQSCIIDYIPKRVYGVWHTLAMRLLDLGTCGSLYGAYLLETESNGLFEFIIKIWGA